MARAITALTLLLALGAKEAKGQRQVSMDVYLVRGQQAEIIGQVQALALAFKLLEGRYEAAYEKLESIERSDGMRFLVTSNGPLRASYEWHKANLGNPAIANPATEYGEALKSILRRSAAGEQWNPNSARRFISEAQQNYLIMQQHIYQQEWVVQQFRMKCVNRGRWQPYRIGGPKW